MDSLRRPVLAFSRDVADSLLRPGLQFRQVPTPDVRSSGRGIDRWWSELVGADDVDYRATEDFFNARMDHMGLVTRST